MIVKGLECFFSFFIEKKYSSRLGKESLIAILGIASEYYNIFLYGYLAYIILPSFFAYPRLILASSIIISFLIGPLGAILCGYVGDTLGRKKILSWTIAGIAFPSFLISILPTYDQIGIYASILFIFFRSIQTLAFSGDMVGLVTFVLEDTPKKKRGLFGGYMSMGAGLGVGTASLFIFLLNPLTDNGFNWKWRVLLCIGVFGMLISIYFAKTLGESTVFKRYKNEGYVLKNPFLYLIKNKKLLLLKAVGLTTLAPIITIVIYGFIPFLSIQKLHKSQEFSMLNNAFALVVFSLGAPLFGYLSDKIGRKIILKAVSLSFLIMGYPLFLFLDNSNATVFFIIQIIFSLISSAYYGVTVTTCIEIFPSHIRYTGISLGYYFTYMLFGGFSGMLIEKELLQHVSLAISPVFYLLFGSILVLISINFIKDKSCLNLQDK